MRKRSKAGQESVRKRGFAAYLHRLTPFALLCMPFWLVLPFLVDRNRIDLVFSGTVAAWKFLLWAGMIVLASYVSSASFDWEERRKSGDNSAS